LLMLEPDTSVLLTDALRPPPGHEVDVAVTTTYSLNLTAMLIAPMTFALASMDEATRIDDGDPAQLLDAVHRFMGRTTVFYQAAGIDVARSQPDPHLPRGFPARGGGAAGGRPVPSQALGDPLSARARRRLLPPRRGRQPQPHPGQLLGHGPRARREQRRHDRRGPRRDRRRGGDGAGPGPPPRK